VAIIIESEGKVKKDIMRPGDFSYKTKRLLAQRVGYMCSNPECRALTCGPSKQSDKIIIAGVAAHITAASSGGPRYNPTLTKEERCGYDNGIWLCARHACVVDKDVSEYSVELLRSWKKKAENHAKKWLGIPLGHIPILSRNLRRYVFLAKSVIAGLRINNEDSIMLGIEGPLKELETLASSLKLPLPIEIHTIPYPDDIIPHNPFLKERFEGNLIIRYPDGCYESGKAAHTSGLEMLIEARDSAIVALEQWILLVENEFLGVRPLD